MKRFTLFVGILCSIALCKNTIAQAIPKYSHVIFVLEENYSYSEIIGSTYAPTLTWLSKQSYTASFSQAFAIGHPSEPNYLELFSGSNQGVTSDLSGPIGAPLNNCNLGSSLIQHGYTFIGYAEDQPTNCSPGSCLGWIAGDAGTSDYVTKHCPWINWIGYNTNPDTIPIASDVPFNHYTANGYTSGPIFPDSLGYDSLPTVSWVIPNESNDMHDPYTASIAIPNGDAWFKTHMMPLVRWAVTHNSLVITIWDEDDGSASDNIPCLFSGANIVGGTYSTPKFDHYDVLKTIEDMYSLTPLCGGSATGTDITNVWVGISTISGIKNEVTVWPVPAKEQLNLKVTSNINGNAVISLQDVTGRIIKERNTTMKPGDNSFTFDTDGLSNGVYFVNVYGSGISLCKKVIIQN
ncbi:MAG TPA: alkaline phosphatase family protein [Bacteroidia bacterium]|jgi:hypothetical protein|nr:alkaline phosphatase family protein [Bacteroidia bacterium]